MCLYLSWILVCSFFPFVLYLHSSIMASYNVSSVSTSAFWKSYEGLLLILLSTFDRKSHLGLGFVTPDFLFLKSVLVVCVFLLIYPFHLGYLTVLVYSCSQYFLIIFSHKVSCNVPFSFLILGIWESFFFSWSIQLKFVSLLIFSKNQLLCFFGYFFYCLLVILQSLFFPSFCLLLVYSALLFLVS